ncbi:MAG: NAD-dependent epimerase/dehydratase family protein [Treponema sp.]|jgi:nucleoside-diphosphate-sugar epimerase|nr:NAD-dependent epimerase/dehydratase family protein [Treponema sp.]
MKVLFIGGTGTISTAISRKVLEQGWELYLLNRGSRNSILTGKVKEIHCDINDEVAVAEKIRALNFDVAADFTIFTPNQIERDWRLLKGKTKQYIFISSASAYQKPLLNYHITESTPLINPFWEYARNKIACEDLLQKVYREQGFPITIVRPSHTYDERSVPLGVHGKNGSWQVIRRMLDGKPVIIHGDGTSLWTITHNSDFANAFIGLMGNIHAIGEAVQITSDETLTWNQIYKAIARILGVPLKAVHISSEFLGLCGPYNFIGGLIGDKANSVVFDTTKLKRLVPGFTATKRFDQGLQETIDYILSHKECQKEDPEFDAWCDKIIFARDRIIREIQGAGYE